MSPSRSYVASVPALAQHKTTTHIEQQLTLTQLLCGFLVQVLNVVTRNLGGGHLVSILEVHSLQCSTQCYAGGPNTALVLSLVGNKLHCTVAQVRHDR